MTDDGNDPFKLGGVDGEGAQPSGSVPPSNKNSEAIGELSDEIQKLNVKINEERFCSAIIILFLFDAYVFHTAESWGGPIAILALQCLLLIAIGRRLGVSDLIRLIDKFLDNRGAPKNNA